MATYTGKVDRSEPKRKKKTMKVPAVTDNTPSSDGGRFPLRGADMKLGSGMAEGARKRLRDRKGQIDKASGN